VVRHDPVPHREAVDLAARFDDLARDPKGPGSLSLVRLPTMPYANVLLRRLVDELRPSDRFNVVTFTTSVNHLWPEAVPNTPERVREAKQFVQGLTAGAVKG